MKVSIIQHNTIWQDVKANLDDLEQRIQKLSPDTELLLLAEMFTTGVTTDVEKVAETMSGSTVRRMMHWADKFQMAIAGSVIIKENGKFYNRFIFVTHEGTLNTYDKRHLFRLGGEDKVITAGTECNIINYKGWRIKPHICYDLRFPVWTRNTAEEEYDLLIYVSNWPKSRDFAYETLLKARAIENQTFVCACNRTGVDGNKIVYAGHSLVIDAKGNTLCDAESAECHITVDLSKEDLNRFRSRFPVIRDADNFSLTE